MDSRLLGSRGGLRLHCASHASDVAEKGWPASLQRETPV